MKALVERLAEIAPGLDEARITVLVQLGFLLLLMAVSYLIAQRLFLRAVHYVVEKTSTKWDDALVERKVFRRLAYLAPATVVFYGSYLFEQELTGIVQRLVTAYVLAVVLSTVGAILSALHDIYVLTGREKKNPLKGYVQVANLTLFLVGSIVIFGIILDKSPWALLSGLGAATAVLLLVFRDTILSFVASIQIAANDTLRVGDWVSMPKYDADGDVVDIALHAVSIQNWDKSITSIPTHRFLDESFRNWRGMFSSGGRRIKRAVFVDQRKVRFATQADRDQWAELPGLSLAELSETRLTNMGAYRLYASRFIAEHPARHEGMTMLVRALAPTPEGLPMEVYLFSREQRWAEYEAIQANIVEHLLAAMPSFDLEPFQHPTGGDWRQATPEVERAL